MADRKVELEKKRKKLEELRKAREQKKKEAVDKEVCRERGGRVANLDQTIIWRQHYPPSRL